MQTIGLAKLISEARRRGLVGMLALYVVGAWVVLQAAALAFPGWDIPDSAIRYVWIGALVLFPLALVFSWRYDVTLKGIQRTPSSGESAAVSLDTLDYWLLSVLIVASGGICYGVAERVFSSQTDRAMWFADVDIPHNSIAVLPFVNMSDDESNEYFSDGISEQLLDELARIPDLHVAARTSAFYYKNKTEKMPVIGRELRVRTLLEGSVRKSGNRIRVTAQLINAEDGFHLWTDTFDRDLNDIFAVQDEIARIIVEMLKIELDPAEAESLVRGGTDNVQAYDQYLRGMAYRRTSALDANVKSAAYFQQAIDLAPDFALAYDALAYGYLLQSFFGSMSIDDAATEASLLIEKALEIEPNLEQAHATLGLLKSRLAKFDEANAHYQTALAINPNYFGGQVNYGLSLVHQGRLKDASSAYLRAQAIDPLNANLSFNLGALLMVMGQFDDGFEFMQRSLTIDPQRKTSRGAMAHWLGVYGRLAEAIRFGTAAIAMEPASPSVYSSVIRAYADLGLPEQAQRIIDNLPEGMESSGPIRNARVRFWLLNGDIDAFISYAAGEFAGVDANLGNPVNAADSTRVREYGWSLLYRGEYQRASEILYWSAGGEEGIAGTTYDYIITLKLLALAYQQLGRHEEAAALLNQCLQLVSAAHENGWATPTLFVRLAEVHALRGDMPSAIENIEIAVEKGWRNIGVLEYGIFWQNHQDNSDLERLKRVILNDLEMQRQQVLDEQNDARRAQLQIPRADV